MQDHSVDQLVNQKLAEHGRSLKDILGSQLITALNGAFTVSNISLIAEALWHSACIATSRAESSSWGLAADAYNNDGVFPNTNKQHDNRLNYGELNAVFNRQLNACLIWSIKLLCGATQHRWVATT